MTEFVVAFDDWTFAPSMLLAQSMAMAFSISHDLQTTAPVQLLLRPTYCTSLCEMISN
jgi:hypothetical protein